MSPRTSNHRKAGGGPRPATTMGQDHSTPGAGCRTPDLLFRLDSFLKFPQSSSGIEVCLREVAPLQASATIYGFTGIANVYGFMASLLQRMDMRSVRSAALRAIMSFSFFVPFFVESRSAKLCLSW